MLALALLLGLMVVLGVVMVRAGSSPPQEKRPSDLDDMDAISLHPYPPRPPGGDADTAGDDD